MPSLPNSPALAIVLSAVIVVIAIVAGRSWSQRRITRWCDEEGYRLENWRGALFYEGPGKWLRSDNQQAYYIEVSDRQGLPRSGYLVFGSYWHPFSRKAKVTWD